MSKRRSAFVGFSAITLSAATLAGCGQGGQAGGEWSEGGEVSKAVYKSVADCKAQNPGTDCDAAFQAAQNEHLQNAPAFQSKSACENDWGQENCVEHPRTGGGSLFLPMMAGFMLGRALTPGMSGAYGGGHAVYSGPRGLWSGGQRIGEPEMRNGRWTTPSRVTVSEGPGGRVAASRGGFGRSASAYGGRGS
jgi:uncharacterized protein YgiB involved in biofilm formation